MTESHQHIYRLHPTRTDMLATGPTNEEAAIIHEHAAYLRQLCDAGVVVLAGRTLTTGPESFGIVILEANEGRARRLMQEDPAVDRGVMTAELLPFRIAMQRQG
jgi:uncharacterized protein YciI